MCIANERTWENEWENHLFHESRNFYVVNENPLNKNSWKMATPTAVNGSASGSGSGPTASIRQILRASNHFDVLQLARPYADLMNQPVWPVSAEAVNRVFRKLSLCCHPDKSSHPDAPRAFETLKKAKACLMHPLDRDDYLINFVKEQKTHWEGSWTSVEAGMESKQRTSTMRDEAQREQGDSVADAMRQRRERAEDAARRKQRMASAQARKEESRRAAEVAVDDDDDDDVGAAPRGGSSGAHGRGSIATAPRKRPKFL